MLIMREFINSVMDSYSERIKNPFLGSFSITFFLYNWRAFLILLFSDLKIEEKIKIIDTEYCNIWALVIPILIAMFYILVLPYINLLFDWILSISQARKEIRKNTVIDNNFVIKKKYATNERIIADLKAGTSEINQLQLRIDALTNENNIKSNHITEIIEKSNQDVLALNEMNKGYSKTIKNLEAEIIDFKDSYTLLSYAALLIVDDNPESKGTIIRFLVENLSKEEISLLRKGALQSINDFRLHIAILLIAMNYSKQDAKDFIYTTPEGRSFLNDYGLV